MEIFFYLGGPMRIQKLLYKPLDLYWRMFKPIIVGVKALLNSDDSVVLVKHTYQDQWHLPGGAVKKRETIEDALKRELTEEIDGALSQYHLFGVYSDLSEGKNGHIIVFLSKNFRFSKKQNFEIEKVQSFNIHGLPETVSKPVQRRIREYKEGRNNIFGIW
jgi:8-oxo-dGTP pyrophosphatase MutT (NUDIX family)